MDRESLLLPPLVPVETRASWSAPIAELLIDRGSSESTVVAAQPGENVEIEIERLTANDNSRFERKLIGGMCC